MNNQLIRQTQLNNNLSNLSETIEGYLWGLHKIESKEAQIVNDLDVTLSIRSGASSYSQLKNLQEILLKKLENLVANEFRTVLMEEKVRFRRDDEEPFVLLNVQLRTVNSIVRDLEEEAYSEVKS